MYLYNVIFILILMFSLNHCSATDVVNIGAAVVTNIEETNDN